MNGQKITNIGSGVIEQGSTDVVSGGDVFTYFADFAIASKSGWVAIVGEDSYPVLPGKTFQIAADKNIDMKVGGGILSVSLDPNIVVNTVSAADSITVGDEDASTFINGYGVEAAEFDAVGTDSNSSTLTGTGLEVTDGTNTASMTATGFTAGTGNSLTTSGLTATKADITGDLTVGTGNTTTTISGNTVTTGTVTASSATIGGSVGISSDGIDMGGKPITNLGSGANKVAQGSTDAVSGGDVYSYLTTHYTPTSDTGWSAAVTNGTASQTVEIGNGDTVTYKAGSNMSLAANGSVITFSTSMTPVFTSAQFGSDGTYSALNSTGLTLSNGAAFGTGGILAGGMKISGLAEGAVNSSSTEAVTGAQLYEALADLGSDITTSIADVTYTKVTGFTINDGVISMTTEEAHLNTPTNTTHGLMKLAVTTDTTASSSGTSGTVSLMDTGTEEPPVTDTIRNVAGDNITITSGEDTIVYATVPDPTFTTVTTGNTTLSSDGLKINGGPSVTASGIDAGNLKITNVKAGEIAAGSTEAVTGGQLWTTNQAVVQNSDAIRSLARADARLNRRINDVGAQAAAIASLHPLPFDEDHRVSVSIGGGAYHGSSAAAVGLFVRPTENSLISLGGAVGSDDVMGNMSFSYRFGGDSLAQKPQQMAAQLTSLKGEVRDLSAQLAAARSRLESVKPAGVQTADAGKVKAMETELETLRRENESLAEELESAKTKLETQKASLESQNARLEKLEAAIRALTKTK